MKRKFILTTALAQVRSQYVLPACAQLNHFYLISIPGIFHVYDIAYQALPFSAKKNGSSQGTRPLISCAWETGIFIHLIKVYQLLCCSTTHLCHLWLLVSGQQIVVQTNQTCGALMYRIAGNFRLVQIFA